MGCSGLAYSFRLADEIAPEDVVFEDNGVKVLVDPKAWRIDGASSTLCGKASTRGFKFINLSVIAAVVVSPSGSSIQRFFVCGRYLHKSRPHWLCWRF
jgi:Fe-S cluster assembly iron-binding protein IscA